MVGQPELARVLSTEFTRWLLRPDVSFEVRWHLQQWSRRLPQASLAPAATISSEELDRIVRQLDDDSYATRCGAAQRLEWLLGNPKLVAPLMLRLKRRLADATLPADAQGPLESAWKRVWGAWLLSDPAGWALPAVADEQIEQWVDDLARPAPAGKVSGRWHVHRTAHRELLVLLARDELVPRVVKALQSRLDQGLDADAVARLQIALELTKPEMVAEYWYGRRHLGEQHLLVGVPLLSAGATRPSYFDRVDEHTAHCVSGNSLSPGDYPVGVAVPHPQQPGALFHLVNLPTPRRRMAYVYYAAHRPVQTSCRLEPPHVRSVLENRQLLMELQLRMLGSLDPAEVSRFAGRYFLQVDDGMLPGSPASVVGGQPSRFGMICAQLAVDGTKDAVPGLTEAIAKQRFLPPTSMSPYRLQWVAAFSIAARDPWPEVDAWLAAQIGNRESFRETATSLQSATPDEDEDLVDTAESLVKRWPGAEIGATAAAALLTRHGQSPAKFELQPVRDPMMRGLHIDGYRFKGSESQGRVQQWWERERASKRQP